MPRLALASPVALLFSALVLACEVHAWGASGHAIVAEIAQRRLDPAVKRQIQDLLGADVSLASISNWADTLAMTAPQTRRWHYVNIPVGASGYDAGRDCKKTAEGDCIVAAIGRAQATLADRSAPRQQRAQALKLLVHLVADIHQPLHCAERDGDAGGARLAVTFFGSASTLHQVWDIGLLEKASYDWGEHVGQIAELMANDKAGSMTQGSPAQWAWETHLVAVTAAYGHLSEKALDKEYQARNLPVVHRQLGLAGLRLAKLLNETLAISSRAGVQPRPRRYVARSWRTRLTSAAPPRPRHGRRGAGPACHWRAR